ncbi:MAG: DUF1801 domain-containing protein [Myxococcales bacterium]|nr:DUF1801 domain-containing protein [Myxococcales bacterium]
MASAPVIEPTGESSSPQGAESSGDAGGAADGDAEPDPERPLERTRRRPARHGGLTVADYAAALVGWKAKAVNRLRAIIAEAAPEARESIKWGQPTYELGGPFSYIAVFKSTVNFGFWRGAELPGEGLLVGGGQEMRHVRLTETTPLDDSDFIERLVSLVRAAAALNRLGAEASGP